jgi:hypothetical protein
MIATSRKEERTALNVGWMIDDIYSDGLLEVARMVRQHNGTVDDARDIFHDALIILIRQVESGKQIDAPLNYLIGTARHLMYRKLRIESTIYDPEYGDLPDIPDEHESRSVNLGRLLSIVSKTGKSCLDFLTALFIERKQLSLVTTQFGLKSEHVASVKKYKCLEQVRNIVKENALDYEDFTD